MSSSVRQRDSHHGYLGLRSKDVCHAVHSLDIDNLCKHDDICDKLSSTMWKRHVVS
jgi:hypothetical protein